MSLCLIKDLPESIFQNAPRRVLATSERLFVEGDSVSFLDVVVSGSIRLVTYPEGDKQLVLHRVGEGELFAVDQFFGSTYSYSAVADVKTTVLRVPREIVARELRSNQAFLERLFRCLADRYVQLSNNFSRLGIRSAKRRVLSLLRDLKPLGSDQIDLRGKFKGLSDDINLTHEAMYRALRDLEKEGAIRRDQGQVQFLLPPNG